MIKLVENIGDKSIQLFSSFYKELSFIYSCFTQTLKPRSYTQSNINILIEQIYIMAIKVIPIFLIIAIIFGGIVFSSIINIMLQYELENFIQYFIKFIISDFAPFFTALLILLRSSVRVNTEISILKLNNKLDNKKENNILTSIFIPRILSGIISSTLLSILFIMTILISLYLSIYFQPYIDLNTLNNILINFINPSDIIFLILKSILFGFILIVIPIYSGLKTTPNYISNGILKLFVIIFTVEILTLLFKLL